METINLQLSIDESNVILKALGEMPYVQVAPLIHKIQQQAGQQLQKKPENGSQNGKQEARNSGKKVLENG